MLIDFTKSNPEDWIIRNKATGEQIYGVIRANDDESWVDFNGISSGPYQGMGGMSKPQRVYMPITINRIARRKPAA